MPPDSKVVEARRLIAEGERLAGRVEQRTRSPLEDARARARARRGGE